MVQPIPNADRSRTFKWVKFATVLLVGLSAGLISVQGGASIVFVVASIGGGGLFGAALVWYLFPDVDDIAPASSHRYRK